MYFLANVPTYYQAQHVKVIEAMFLGLFVLANLVLILLISRPCIVIRTSLTTNLME